MARIREVKRTSLIIDPRSLPILLTNLKFVYDSVVASEQLLIDAARQLHLLPPDVFNDQLVSYYSSHLEEERDHAEWLREDLESAGVNVAPAKYGKVAMAMIGTQYYLIKHAHPAALLGYMAIVEGDPVPLSVVEFLERRYGETLLRFVRFHATKDLEHRKELFEIIDNVPNHMTEVIIDSAENSLGYMVEAAATWSNQV